MRSNLTREQFETHVRTAKEHIAAGDIYQVVLSQRFEADVAADPFTVYRALRHVNPSPYMFFIRMGELLDRRRVARDARARRRARASRRIRSPARARAARPSEEDQRLAEELRRNEKERAEHVMLVDLGRNDIGRVCEFGSVRVPQFMALERYSHVMHLVSIVEGKLADDTRPARRAGGVLSGRHADGRAQDARDGDHRRARADAARPVRRARSATSTSPATSISASPSARS